MALAHQTRWGVSRSLRSKGSWACKQCLYDFLPVCPFLYHPSSWVGHEKSHGQRGSGVLHCRTLLSLEDGCSHWLQISLLLSSSQNRLWKCFWSRGNSSKDFVPFLLFVPLDNFCVNDPTLCLLVQCPWSLTSCHPDHLQIPIWSSTQGDRVHVFTKGSARIMVALKSEIIPISLKKKNEYFIFFPLHLSLGLLF